MKRKELKAKVQSPSTVGSPSKKAKYDKLELPEIVIRPGNEKNYQVREVFELMFDENTWRSTLNVFRVGALDYKSITKEKIEKCSALLRSLYESITEMNTDSIKQLSEEYYSEIPHIETTLVDTIQSLNDKLVLLRILYSIQQMNELKKPTLFETIRTCIENLKFNFFPLAKGELYSSISMYV